MFEYINTVTFKQFTIMLLSHFMISFSDVAWGKNVRTNVDMLIGVAMLC